MSKSTYRSKLGSLMIGDETVSMSFDITVHIRSLDAYPPSRRGSLSVRKPLSRAEGTIYNAVLSRKLWADVLHDKFSISGGVSVCGQWGMLTCEHCVCGDCDMLWLEEKFAEQEFVECAFKFAVTNACEDVILIREEINCGGGVT